MKRMTLTACSGVLCLAVTVAAALAASPPASPSTSTAVRGSGVSGAGAGGAMGGGGAIGAASGGDGQSQLLNATKSMSETQMSFNLQNLKMLGPTPPKPPAKAVAAKDSIGH